MNWEQIDVHHQRAEVYGGWLVMNGGGMFSMGWVSTPHFRDYDTWVDPLSDYCKSDDVVWMGEE